jgi:hypothetical protein
MWPPFFKYKKFYNNNEKKPRARNLSQASNTIKNNIQEINSQENAETSKTNKQKKNEVLYKTLKNNTFLSMIVSPMRNKLWYEELSNRLNVLNCIILINNKAIIFTKKRNADENQLVQENSWPGKVDKILGDFFKCFYTKVVNYNIATDQNQLAYLTNKIEELRSNYLCDFKLTQQSKVFIICKQENSLDLQSRLSMLKIFSEPESTDETKKNEAVSILQNKANLLPDSTTTELIDLREASISVNLNNHISLINLALKKFKEDYNLEDFNFDCNKRSITLVGFKKSVEEVSRLIQHSLLCIRTKAIEKLNKKILKCKNLNKIIKECLKDSTKLSSFIYKIELNTTSDSDDEENENDQEEEDYIITTNKSGIYVSYFENCLWLNSPKHKVYEEIRDSLIAYLGYFELDVTKHHSTLIMAKWRKFEQENLNKAKSGNHFSYNLYTSSNDGRICIELVGIKDYLMPIKQKIEEFLSSNSHQTSTIPLSEIDVCYYFLLFIGVCIYFY